MLRMVLDACLMVLRERGCRENGAEHGCRCDLDLCSLQKRNHSVSGITN
jgi:hypothetical protein